VHRLYRRGLQEAEPVVADEAWGIWEALEVVYSKARDSSVCGILEGPWRACPGEEGRKKKKLQKEFLADLQSSESPGSSGKTVAFLQEVVWRLTVS